MKKEKNDVAPAADQSLSKKLENLERIVSDMKQTQDLINRMQESINNSMMKIITALEVFRSATNVTLKDMTDTLELHQSALIGLEEIVYLGGEQAIEAHDMLNLPEIEDKNSVKKMN